MSDPSRREKIPRKATPEILEAAAHDYVKRFATTAAHLRRVLMRRVIRSARFHGTDPDQGAVEVERIVSDFAKAGFLDDRLYARARARELRLRGASARLVRARLREKGVDEDLIAESLAEVDEENTGDGDGELSAAWALARRRRLGAFRTAGDRAARRERDLAALSRAGFSYDVARQVVDGNLKDGPDSP